MLPVIVITAFLDMQAAPPQPQTEPPRLISYAEAVACTGVTQAASELEGGESAEGRALYDAALYWSLSTIQASAIRGDNPEASELQISRARLNAVRRLSAGDEEIRRTLRECRQKTPAMR